MLKKTIKAILLPAMAVGMFIGLNSFTGESETPGEGEAVYKVISAITCYGKNTGMFTSYGTECTKGAGNCVANPCPEGTKEKD